MKLRDICDGITDGSHNPPQGIDSSEYFMLSSKNIFDNNITLDEPRYLTEEQFASENKRTQIASGDVLMTIVGTVGRAAVVDESLPSIVLQRSVAVLHPKKEICDSRYLMYALRSKRAAFEKEAHGVAQKGIYLKQLSDTEIELPEKDEQIKVVELLDKMDRVISLGQQELDALDELIKARFVEMFGDVATEDYKYETKKLGTVAEVGSSHRVFTSEFVEEGIPFYRGTEIGELANGQKPSDPYYISEEHYNRLANDETKPKVGDLLMPSICNKGQVWMVDTDDPFYYKDGRVLCISPDREIYNPKYLQYFMRVKTQVEYPKMGSGSTFAEFKIFLLKDFDILTPPRTIQDEFTAFVEQVDKSKVAVQKSLDEAQLLFNSLMQVYFG